MPNFWSFSWIYGQFIKVPVLFILNHKGRGLSSIIFSPVFSAIRQVLLSFSFSSSIQTRLYRSSVFTTKAAQRVAGSRRVGSSSEGNLEAWVAVAVDSHASWMFHRRILYASSNFRLYWLVRLGDVILGQSASVCCISVSIFLSTKCTVTRVTLWQGVKELSLSLSLLSLSLSLSLSIYLLLEHWSCS